MTRAYINRKKYVSAYTTAFARIKNGSVDLSDVQLKIQEYMQDAVFNMAARFIRYGYEDICKFQECFLQMSGLNKYHREIFDKTPLMVFEPGNNPDAVRVYRNIIVDQGIYTELTNLTFCTSQHKLKTFYTSYKEDLADENKKQGWDTIRRAWQKIKRYEVVSIATALTRYTNLKNVRASSDIRDIATAMLESRQPLSLIYADKPEDMITMYQGGPDSCMNNSKAKSQAWDTSLFPSKHHPCSWYAYHPYIRGVYTMLNKQIVARTYVYQLESGKWQYGRVYATNEVSKSRFVEALEAAEYEFMGNHSDHKYNRVVKFDIPAITSDAYTGTSEKLLAFPYMDNMEANIQATYDADMDVFHIECGSASPNVNPKYTKGLWTATMLQNPSCSYCGHSAMQNGRALVALDGTVFCHTEHMRAGGYTNARRGDGLFVIVLKRDAYVDRDTDWVFTNKGAAVSLGALPIIGADGVEDEDSENITFHGTIIRKGTNFFRCPSSAPAPETMRLTSTWVAPCKVILPQALPVYEFINEEEFMAPATITTQRVVEFERNAPLVIQAA